MLLLALLRERPSYGYELCVRLRERSGGALSFEDGAIYPLLHDFERRKMVEGYWESGATPDGGGQALADSEARKGPRRRYYRLTSGGHAALVASVEDWRAFSEAVARVLAAPDQGLAIG